MMKNYKDNCNMPWLEGYNLTVLKEFYNKNEQIKEYDKETYKSYIECVNKPYENLNFLNKYIDISKYLEISNHGNIKFKNEILSSTLVSDGPHKGIFPYYDNYKEILIPGIEISNWIFIDYRLVAEIWCDNPDITMYTIVHHIGNDNFNNSKNLLFVTDRQHDLIHNKLIK